MAFPYAISVCHYPFLWCFHMSLPLRMSLPLSLRDGCALYPRKCAGKNLCALSPRPAAGVCPIP
eukprot:3425881-Rhodomonas_salina.1